MLLFLVHLILTAALLLLVSNLVQRRLCSGLGFCARRRACSRFRECRCATAYGTPHVAFHDSYLWALSPGGQRAHALVGGGIGTGHPCSGYWVRIAGELGAYVAQSCRRASHITRATL